ncbi:hypothetical protein AYO38_06765 [bacterium SCGC AG-212-C10]|nr:hypothetical protein AYO38_06765 [bacterium SCGC AG-212-C10]
MKQLVIVRHAQRQNRADNSSHLSSEGIAMAQRVGASLGSFDLVATSTLPRAFETAIAMGFAVDQRLEDFHTQSDESAAEVTWYAGFAAWAEAYRRGAATTEFCDRVAAICRDLIARVSEGGAVLVVSHGGVVEACAVALAPSADHAAWGEAAGYCEGVRLRFEAEHVVSAQTLRTDPANLAA